MNDLNFYKGHWSAIPHALAALTSGNAFLLLFNIIRSVPKSICSQPIFLSKSRLAAAMGVSYHTVNNSIKELEKLNLVSVKLSNGSATSFHINWDEVEKIHEVSSQITDEGWGAVRKMLCRNEGGLQTIEKQNLDFIKQQYKRAYAENAYAENAYAENAYAENAYAENAYAENAYAENAEVNNEPMQKLHRLTTDLPRTYAEIAKVIDEPMQKLHRLITAYAENAEVMAMLKEKVMQYGLDTLLTYAKTAKATYAESAEVGSSTYAKTAYSIDIYKIKKDDSERSSLNKGGEQKEKIEKWFEERDLSFPVLSSTDFETIINLSDFSDEDYDKAVRQVWGYLQYDNNPENIESNFIPAELFMDCLYRAWNDLKEIDPAFSLSEQDMKNIFGFDLEEHNGELCCYITPSKLHNITIPATTISKPVRTRNVKDRTCRRLFVEAVTEIAKQDEKLLSDAEYIVWQIIKTVEENKVNNQSRYDEVTKLQYDNLVGVWSEETGIPVNDVKGLLKELPQKGKISLSVSQLLPEKFFKYNHDHNDTANVEELFKQKLNEYEEEDGETD